MAAVLVKLCKNFLKDLWYVKLMLMVTTLFWWFYNVNVLRLCVVKVNQQERRCRCKSGSWGLKVSTTWKWVCSVVAFRLKPHIDRVRIRPGFSPLINVQSVKTICFKRSEWWVWIQSRWPVIDSSNDCGRTSNHEKEISADSAEKYNLVCVQSMLVCCSICKRHHFKRQLSRVLLFFISLPRLLIFSC